MKALLIPLLALCGACAAMESSLNRTATVERPEAATVSVSLAALDALSDTERALLEQHLTSSAAWVVKDEPGRRVAYRNWLQTDGGWDEAFNGYWSDFSQDLACPDAPSFPALASPRCGSASVLQARVMLALDKPEQLSHRDRGHFTRAPTQGPVTLALEDYLDQPGLHSWLVVEGQHLMVEVMEQAAPNSRPFTQAALDSLRDELAAVRAGEGEIRARGFVSAWAPAAGWTEADKPTLTLTGAERPGRYTAELWLNPGEPGTLSVALVYLGPSSEGPSPEGLSAGDTVITSQHGLTTRLGWGAEPAIRFGTTAAIWVEQGKRGEAFEGRLEVRFTPDTGGPARVLADHTQVFTGRERPESRSDRHGAER